MLLCFSPFFSFFFFNDTATTEIYTLSLHDALPISQGLRDSFWLQGMQAAFNAALDCIKAFSETDFTEDLKKIDVPTLVIHGDDDQIVPIGASALRAAKLIKNARLEV